MADKEIGDLTAASALDGTETVHVVQGGNSRRTTTQGIADLGGGAASLADLTDVDLTGVVDGDVLVYEASSGKFYAGSNVAAPAFRGALVTKSANQILANTTDTDATWDQEAYDTDGIHDNSTNNERLTVPPGVSKVRLRANIAIQNEVTAANHSAFLHIRKNGIFTYDGRATQEDVSGNIDVDRFLNVSSPVLAVVPGDYFTATVFQTSGETLNILTHAASWFAMEIVE